MKYKWILFGVGSVVAVVLCWVFGVFICYDRIELTVRVGKVTDIFQPDASSSKVVLLKIKSSGNLRIDWGDGVVDDVVIDSCKHTYEDDGNYNISIRGENIYERHFFHIQSRLVDGREQQCLANDGRGSTMAVPV